MRSMMRSAFRDQLIAASLKAHPTVLLREDFVFPRSIDRGLIEGVSPPLMRWTIFPFPRSIDRGLIEGASGAAGAARPGPFRDQLIAASLKGLRAAASPRAASNLSAIN